MNNANFDEIKNLIFNRKLTIVEISKGSGVGKTTLGKYRRGESALENMSFGNAIKLQNYYNKIKGIEK